MKHQIPARVAERAFLRARPEGEHMLTTYSIVPTTGYGQVTWREGARTINVSTHVAAWVHVHGQVPDGMTVDHTCRVRACVRVEHLRLLPLAANSARHSGDDWPLEWACKRNHDVSARFVNSAGYRECRACVRERRTRRRTAA